ncbi:hypothetical protein HN958_01560 [Candidatus Falkowbacteria bacterium]|jgi:hypothetical protein|nr:hypothetical protein [Candidatus Falkowbacteria bacterium]MBT7007171.1 hypothetical protein [Candidatus Falkowbacteria bacterium]
MTENGVKIIVVAPTAQAESFPLFVERQEWRDPDLMFVRSSAEIQGLEDGKIDLAGVDAIIFCGEDSVDSMKGKILNLISKIKVSHPSIYLLGFSYFEEHRKAMNRAGCDHVSYMLIDVCQSIQTQFNW